MQSKNLDQVRVFAFLFYPLREQRLNFIYISWGVCLTKILFSGLLND